MSDEKKEIVDKDLLSVREIRKKYEGGADVEQLKRQSLSFNEVSAEQLPDKVDDPDARALAVDTESPASLNSTVEEDADAGNSDQLLSVETIGFIDALLKEALDLKASDIHFETYANSRRVRVRVNGVLRHLRKYDRFLEDNYGSCIARLKILAGLNIAERRLPQDGAYSFANKDAAVDIRASFLPAKHGERVVLRLLATGDFNGGLADLQLPKSIYQALHAGIHKSQGLVLVTGPTGSGKSTTLYAALRDLNSVERNILTCEDPVEYQLEGVSQVQIREDIGLTFASVLRSFLRQDPEVILVGEIRDAETADIAIKASLTGHLVMSTLHTNDAVSTVTRLLNMGIPDYLISTSLNLVLAQRLVRKLCSQCAVPANQSNKALYRSFCEPLSYLESASTALKMAVGCKFCQHTGYSGRIPLFEGLVPSRKFLQTIRDGVSTEELRGVARDDGFISIHQNALELLKNGVTSIDEVTRVLGIYS